MNKCKKSEYKKVLVRNVERQIPKITAVEPEISSDNDKEQEVQTAKTKKNEKKSAIQSKSTSKIAAPELQSTLRLCKKIDEITLKPCKTKSLSNVDRNKMLTCDEKVTRKVNFPYEQAIYKGLIPLSCHSSKSQLQQSCPVSRVPSAIQKDKEPDLSNFIAPRKEQHFYYLPTVKLDNSPFITSSTGSNLKLYSIIQINNKM